MENNVIRVLHCVAGLGRGGYETFIMNVYRKIDRTKVQFDFLYSFDGVFTEEAKSLGSRLYKIPFITEKGPFAYRKNVMEFFRSHPEYRIVHSHMDKFSGEIMECAKKCGVPVRIAHSHNTKNEGGFLFQFVKDYYGRKLQGNYTHRFGCSLAAYRWLFGTENDAVIVKNGVDIDKFALPDSRDNCCFVVTNIGRFTSQKNHAFLIDIFAELYNLEPSAKLVLAGTGELQHQIREKVIDLGLEEAVEFLGDCNDVPGLLSRTDVVCMPSLFEGLPVSLVETQAAGVPCVISTGVPAEVDVTGTVEFLSLSDSPKKWAETLLKYKGVPKYDNSRKIAEAGYDIRQTAEFLQEFYVNNAGNPE